MVLAFAIANVMSIFLSIATAETIPCAILNSKDIVPWPAENVKSFFWGRFPHFFRAGAAFGLGSYLLAE